MRLLIILLAILASPAIGRDLGQYAQAPQELRDWFSHLHSKANQRCCDDADGYDAQWDTQGNHYRVLGPEGWVEVPDEALVDGPNKVGVAKVWWGWSASDGRVRVRLVRCFMPGTQT